MKPNRELALAVKRALATGTIALCGVGAVAAYAQQATTSQATTSQSVAAEATAAKATTKRASTAKTAAANKRIMLAQATSQESSTAASADNNVTAPPQLETVVVTGTMIARPAQETAEALTVVSANSLKNQGITNVEQALSQITSNNPGVTTVTSVSSWSGGASFANLRDLGASKTLVLLDGQRLANNVVFGNSVDINGIPFAALDTVQVLREGASSLY